MSGAEPLFGAVTFVMQEAALFAACGFLLLGLSDLAVDLIWIVRTSLGFHEVPTVRDLGQSSNPGLLAVFIAAWQEAEVIAPMLRRTLATFGDGDYRLYVGCYPNDPATIAQVRSVADPRVRLVIGSVPGPTTKADCLNRLWERLLADEREEKRRAKAVVLHDAEDLVHPDEPRIFDRMIEDHDLVQLPVLPLIDRDSRWVGGHYADEFAESHGKELVVRQALGAALPSAGVGCAFSRTALERVADGGLPFDAESVTEDYELGLKIAAAGGRSAFVRIRSDSGEIVRTEEYFPATVEAAVRQKARWMAGIALLGWDRLGWSGGLCERWMRLRDRQSLLAALLLFAAYSALILWCLLTIGGAATGWDMPRLPPALLPLAAANMGLLVWRMLMRLGFTAHAYGWREGLRSAPRMVVSNLIAILAAGRALSRYREARRTGRSRWEKTVHAFPAELPAE